MAYWTPANPAPEGFKEDKGFSGIVEESGGGQASATTYYYQGGEVAKVTPEGASYSGVKGGSYNLTGGGESTTITPQQIFTSTYQTQQAPQSSNIQSPLISGKIYESKPKGQVNELGSKVVTYDEAKGLTQKGYSSFFTVPVTFNNVKETEKYNQLPAFGLYSDTGYFGKTEQVFQSNVQKREYINTMLESEFVASSGAIGGSSLYKTKEGDLKTGSQIWNESALKSKEEYYNLPPNTRNVLMGRSATYSAAKFTEGLVQFAPEFVVTQFSKGSITPNELKSGKQDKFELFDVVPNLPSMPRSVSFFESPFTYAKESINTGSLTTASLTGGLGIAMGGSIISSIKKTGFKETVLTTGQMFNPLRVAPRTYTPTAENWKGISLKEQFSETQGIRFTVARGVKPTGERLDVMQLIGEKMVLQKGGTKLTTTTTIKETAPFIDIKSSGKISMGTRESFTKGIYESKLVGEGKFVKIEKGFKISPTEKYPASISESFTQKKSDIFKLDTGEIKVNKYPKSNVFKRDLSAGIGKEVYEGISVYTGGKRTPIYQTTYNEKGFVFDIKGYKFKPTISGTEYDLGILQGRQPTKITSGNLGVGGRQMLKPLFMAPPTPAQFSATTLKQPTQTFKIPFISPSLQQQKIEAPLMVGGTGMRSQYAGQGMYELSEGYQVRSILFMKSSYAQESKSKNILFTDLSTRQIQINKPREDIIFKPISKSTQSIIDITKQRQEQILIPILKQPPKNPPATIHYDIPRPTPPIIGGFALPALDFFTGDREYRKGKRRLKRNPSLYSAVFKIKSLKVSKLEMTGIFGRPILSSRRRRKR